MSRMWFAAKRIGYGSGLPIAWQGWALLAIFAACMYGLHRLAQLYALPSERGVVQLVGTFALLVPFGLIVRAKTEGGWRWRNGDDA